MLNWVQAIVEVIKYLWPFRIVEQWEEGGFYVWAKYKKTLGPGIWPIVPYFMDVKASSVVPGIVSTPLQQITLIDGRQFSFSAAATVQIFDVNLAWNKVDKVAETVRESTAGLTAEYLMDAEPGRLDGTRRRRLVSSIRAHINEELKKYGTECLSLRFTNFGVDIRTYRFMTDTALLNTAW